MPSRARRAVAALVGLLAAVGAVLAVVGLWLAVRLGPTGVADVTVATPASGAVAIPARYVNAVDVPFEVVASRGDGGPVWVGAATAADADLLLGRGAHSVVTEVSYPSGSAQLRSTGSGPAADVAAADIWRASSSGAGRARLVVAQGEGPLTVVAASGEEAPLRDLRLTLVWRKGAWFVQAMLLTLTGVALAGAALAYLWRHRRTAATAPATGPAAATARPPAPEATAAEAGRPSTPAGGGEVR